MLCLVLSSAIDSDEFSQIRSMTCASSSKSHLRLAAFFFRSLEKAGVYLTWSIGYASIAAARRSAPEAYASPDPLSIISWVSASARSDSAFGPL